MKTVMLFLILNSNCAVRNISSLENLKAVVTLFFIIFSYQAALLILITFPNGKFLLGAPFGETTRIVLILGGFSGNVPNPSVKNIISLFCA